MRYEDIVSTRYSHATGYLTVTLEDGTVMNLDVDNVPYLESLGV